MFLFSLSKPFSNRLRDTAVFAARVPCGPLIVLVAPLLDFTFSTVLFQQEKFALTIWCASLSAKFSCCWCLWCSENVPYCFLRFSKHSIVPLRFVTSFIAPIIPGHQLQKYLLLRCRRPLFGQMWNDTHSHLCCSPSRSQQLILLHPPVCSILSWLLSWSVKAMFQSWSQG